MINPAEIDLSSLLARWLGPARFTAVQLEELPPTLPAPLRDWYTLTSPWLEVRSAGTRIYEPACIQGKAGRVAFMEDPTGDWTWAFDSHQPNKTYEGESKSSLIPCSETLPELLTHATVRSIILMAHSSRLGTQVSDEDVLRILNPIKIIGFGGWGWPRAGYQVYAADKFLMEVGPAIDPQAPWLNRAGYSAVRIAALNDSDLAYLNEYPTGTWIDTGINP
ncbi:hypothetical protein [Streptomyces sp. CA-146814]|uniref:hypothetical protein n=1 Tax=Streptomyces sp. CA-146814 TaxID=3240053 RepID=UPI003D935261